MTERTSKSAEETTLDDIRLNYEAVKQNVAEAMDKANRIDKVRIMAVTKTIPCEKINYAESLGIDLLGENRVQEFLGKYENYLEKSEIHFIGGLQKNKVKYIIDKVSMIHSVDSADLAAEINRRAAQHGLDTDILLEVNIGGELSKGGVAPAELIETAKVISEQKTLSPFCTPANLTAICKAAVPEARATAYLQPIFSHSICSTALIFSPTVDIQLVS